VEVQITTRSSYIISMIRILRYSPYPLIGSSTELRGPDNGIDVSDEITYQNSVQ
jgi:hypothetical protein